MAINHTAALKAMALCSSLSAAEIDAIAAIAAMRSVAADAELFREGDAGDGLYLVVTGEINIIKRGQEGDHVLAKLGPGAVLGEMSLVTSDARSATGRALTDATVVHLPAREFRALLDSGSTAALRIAAAIAEVLARRLATMNGLVLGLAATPEPATAKGGAMKTQDLRDLHRTMQVWSI
jgi:CRP/FNR family transcriptional regulator, cyclic AMP receptor protein